MFNYKQNYKYTKYPKIYEKINWGRKTPTFAQINKDKDIYENRNNFIQNFNIKRSQIYTEKFRKSITPLRGMIYDRYKDYIEYYRTNINNIVMIISISNITNEEEEKFISFGLIKIDPMFTITTSTYIYYL